jgi:hypothetical protein
MTVPLRRPCTASPDAANGAKRQKCTNSVSAGTLAVRRTHRQRLPHGRSPRAMTPYIAIPVPDHLPNRIVDESPTPAVLDLEAGRRHDVEGNHVVVRMLAKIGCQRDIALRHQVEGDADVVERGRCMRVERLP